MRSIARVLTVVEAIDQLAVVAVRIVARPRRVVSAVTASGVRSSWEALAGESLLFGDVCLEPREEAVDGVAQILQLVAGPKARGALFRLRSEICRVVAVIVRSGRRTRPATSQPSAIETAVMIARRSQTG